MKLYSRHPLLEEAFAQTLSGKRDRGRQNVSGHRDTAGDSTHCVIWQTNLTTTLVLCTEAMFLPWP